MDMKRKKQLLEEYKNRRPEMGVISYRCIATNESFLNFLKQGGYGDEQGYRNSCQSV